MAMDGEDPWNTGKEWVNGRWVTTKRRKSQIELLTGLKNISEKVHKKLNTSFVFGACFGHFLESAPEYVIPILILPEPDVYDRRWKSRNPNDKQNYAGRYKICQRIAKNNKNILVLRQPQDEYIDVTIYRICELIINKLSL